MGILVQEVDPVKYSWEKNLWGRNATEDNYCWLHHWLEGDLPVISGGWCNLPSTCGKEDSYGQHNSLENCTVMNN